MKKLNISIILIAFLTFVSCGNNNGKKEIQENEKSNEEAIVVLSEQQQKALNLKLGTFEMRNLTTVVKTNGQLEVAPEKKADITAIIGGNVKAIKVFNGDKVLRGQILAILEHPDYIKLQEDFSVIANNLEFLKQEYNRQKELFENSVGSGKEYQRAKADYNIAKAKYQGLKSRLQLLNLSPDKVKNGQISNTINITSPISGFVTDVNIKLGTYVDAKHKMFGIAETSAIHADFMVYEKDVQLVKIGQKIHFTVSNRSSEEFTASIFAIGKIFDPKTRAVHIHSKINEDIAGLIPGMYISGHLHTNKYYTKTLPDDAIVKEGAKSYIFIVDNEKNKQDAKDIEETKAENHTVFKMIEVITGKQDEGYTEVQLVDSLPSNTRIVLNSAYYLLSDMNKEEMSDDD